MYLLPSLTAYLLHHSSLSILGNAFLAPPLLAAAEKSPEWPGHAKRGPVFWRQPPSCSPVWGSTFRWQGWVHRGRGEQNIFHRGDWKKTTTTKQQETRGELLISHTEAKGVQSSVKSCSPAPLRPPQTWWVRAAVVLRETGTEERVVGLLLAVSAKARLTLAGGVGR